MRTSERHQLKQDKFAEATKDILSSAVEHRGSLAWGVLIVVATLAVGLGSWWYWNSRNQQASLALGKAIETYNAPLVAPDTAPGGQLSFPTAQARASAAHAQFQQVADRYGLTKPGHMARYLEGTTALDMGDTKTGETQLKDVADSGSSDLASLAKLALAGVYRNTNRDQDALRTYQDLVNHPTNSVSKPMAQLELASFYEAVHQAGEAGKVYDQIIKNAPQSAAAALAQQRLQALK